MPINDQLLKEAIFNANIELKVSFRELVTLLDGLSALSHVLIKDAMHLIMQPNTDNQEKLEALLFAKDRAECCADMHSKLTEIIKQKRDKVANDAGINFEDPEWKEVVQKVAKTFGHDVPPEAVDNCPQPTQGCQQDVPNLPDKKDLFAEFFNKYKKPAN